MNGEVSPGATYTIETRAIGDHYTLRSLPVTGLIAALKQCKQETETAVPLPRGHQHDILTADLELAGDAPPQY